MDETGKQALALFNEWLDLADRQKTSVAHAFLAVVVGNIRGVSNTDSISRERMVKRLGDLIKGGV